MGKFISKIKDYVLGLKIRQKIFYPSFIVALCLIFLFSAAFVYIMKRIFEQEWRHNLMTLASTMSMLVSIQSRTDEELGPEREQELLLSLLEPGKMKKQFLYLAVLEPNGKLIGVVKPPGAEDISVEDEGRRYAKRLAQRRIVLVDSLENRMVFASPIYLAGVFRAVLLGSISVLEMNMKVRKVVLLTVGVSLLILLASYFVLRKMADSIAQPVGLLRDAADDLRERRFDSGLEKLKARRWGRDELGFLKESFTFMGENLRQVLERLEDKIALVNADLRLAHEELKKSHKILQEKQKLLEKELDYAREIQIKLLPPLPSLPQFDMYARMQTAASVGGDFYSYRRDREKNLTVIIGDVSGHGVPSALIMVLMREAFSRYAAVLASPQEILTRMNRVACAEFAPEMFTTAFVARFDSQGRKLDFANAGHNLPLFLRGDEVYELDTTGFALGVSPEGHYGLASVELTSGDILFLYTDGLAELRHKSTGEFLGTEKIAALLRQNKGSSARELGLLVERLMREHGGEPPYGDDATFMLIKVL
ncbi:MAG: SpoIIE family protein phosphatase [Leptospiraceae bacterium]|nr:SpoIIE family protein phosphatase [Leptospiraceae bacterium]MDW8306002.1 SpoIIE family protein phosphatase [Leptospiraceae bacterium]